MKRNETVNKISDSSTAIHWLTTVCFAAFVVSLLGLSGCDDSGSPSTSRTARGENTSPDPGIQALESDDSDSKSGDGGTGSTSGGGGVIVSGTTVTIKLPSDQSRYPAGPAMPLADGAPCLACHDTGDVNEFTASRSPNYELVNEECRGCHSADYALYQPPQTNAGWAKVVKKMADKFDTTIVNGVPVVDVMLNPVHQALMTDYLTAINGK